MHIEQVILEGFKTYVNRTVISGFDPQFNAITGFNGSGKSNILDAIQFLLGSTNKEMLRLKSNLTELIYKEGCSGIEKASISIKFRCLDHNLRPAGYEGNEELLVTRQISKDKVSKFFINGLASNLGKVKALFRSVHLNIENPHFLVKQGQITKIINLKPGELLGMIEETAGTAIYNKTKMESDKMIKNKQIKLESINEILKTSIVPQMDKLKIDRKKYTAFKQKEFELKNLTELIKTYQFTTKKNLVQKKQYELNHVKDQLISKKQLLSQNSQRLVLLENQIKVLKNKSGSNVFTDFAKVTEEMNQKQNEQKQIKKRIEKFGTDSHALNEERALLEEQLDRKKQEWDWKSKELINQQKQKEEIEALLRQANTSKGEEDAIKIFQKQIKQERDQVRQAEIEIKAMTSKLQMIKNDEKMDKNTRIELESASGSIAQAIDQLTAQIAKLQIIDPPKQVEDPEITNSYLQRLQQDRKKFFSQHYQFKFLYNDPTPNFDRTKVKGRIYSLFTVKDRTHEKEIESGAGGKLFNIVVENEVTSKLLVQRETFGKSVSIVPNNKIKFKEINYEAVNEAKRIANELGGLAKPAYQLILFNDQIRNSIMFAFSNFIVCSSTQIAKRIAFNNQQKYSCKCVTYEGDVFQRGTLTGGYTNSNSLVLNSYNELREIERKISEEQKKFEVERSAYNEYLVQQNQYKNMKKDIELKTNRRQKFRAKLNDLSLNHKKRNFAEEIDSINRRLEIIKQELQNHQDKEEQLKTKLKKGGKSIQEQKKEILNEKKKLDKKVDQIKKQESLLEVEIDSLTNKIAQANKKNNENQEQIMRLQKKLRDTNHQLIEAQGRHETLQQQKKKVEKEQAISESKLHFLLTEQNSLKSQLKKYEADVIALDREHSSSISIIEINTKEIKKLLEQCSWLEMNRVYDVNQSFDYEAAVREYKALTVDVDRLKKTAKITIDDHSYEKLLEQYNSLLEKREILQKDKLTLLNNMHDLDDKRTKTLENCYHLVKQNLSKIFNDLLPGATAHLNLIDESDVTKGAELQVQFNKVKKELSELSGGQRSLLALSFILALLLYKPSPFYILDEIDSALDLSHTQNIGYMISQRFPQSQFILISLKEGMFQNANILYKVHFAEGESKVDRQVLKKK